MLAGIKNILIIVNKGQIKSFQNILGNGERLGIKIQYKIQNKPKGIPDAFILGASFIKKDNVCLILGDNFFLWPKSNGQTLKSKKPKSWCYCFLKSVKKSRKLWGGKNYKNQKLFT